MPSPECTLCLPHARGSARAKARLADEYDHAQERAEAANTRERKPDGTLAASGATTCGTTGQDDATAADLGLRRDEIHEARRAGQPLRR